jgi:hypothetical protein
MLDTTTGGVGEVTLLHEGDNVRSFIPSCQDRCEWGSKPRDRCSGFKSPGRTGNRMSGGTSGTDSRSRAPEAETGSARCGFDSEVADGKPLSGDLAAEPCWETPIE